MTDILRPKHFVQLRQSLKERFIHLKANVLELVVPVRMRRAIFASSLVAYLNGVTCPDKALATRIGTLMDLTCDPSSLMYPMQINHFIWKNLPQPSINLQTKQCMTPHELRDFCTDIITRTPTWLHYNTRRAMREDVYRLIKTFVASSCRTNITA